MAVDDERVHLLVLLDELPERILCAGLDLQPVLVERGEQPLLHVAHEWVVEHAQGRRHVVILENLVAKHADPERLLRRALGEQPLMAEHIAVPLVLALKLVELEEARSDATGRG